MNLGALAIGLCVGAALWMATDNVVFLSVGLVFGIAFGMFDKTRSDETDEPGDADTDTDAGPTGGSDDEDR